MLDYSKYDFKKCTHCVLRSRMHATLTSVNITSKKRILAMNLDEFSQNKSKANISTTGKVLIAITGGVAVGLSIICIPFVSPAFRKVCLPYMPATDIQIKNVLLALGKNNKGKSLIDLGSGDGRIVLECSKINSVAHGVELNPWLVLYSKIDAFRKGFGGNTEFYRKDLWQFDISNYNNVVIFGVEQMMWQLEEKIKNECQSNTKVIACRFPLPNLLPIKTIGNGADTVWVYITMK